MITSQKQQLNKDYDILISDKSKEFKISGLKSESVIRTTRLAGVNKSIFIGSIGSISSNLHQKAITNIVNWLNS
jgi:mRNA interferase MazF